MGRGMMFLDLIRRKHGPDQSRRKIDLAAKAINSPPMQAWVDPPGDHARHCGSARTNCIPVHMVETINKVMRVERQLLQELGRQPAPERGGQMKWA